MVLIPTGKRLAEVPREQWPVANMPPGIARVLCSARFLVQVFEPGPGGAVRLSVNRVERSNSVASWKEGVTWDELQRLKAEAGYGDAWAVEVFPADADVVNITNMRHLWVLPEAPPFAWRQIAVHPLTTLPPPGQCAGASGPGTPGPSSTEAP